MISTPNWGPIKINHEKRWHPPVRSVDLSFQGNSSYKEKFAGHEQAKLDLYKTDFSNFSAYGTKFSLAPKEKLRTATTYGEKMKNYTANDLNSKVVVRASQSTPTPATSVHFQTTSKEHYRASTPVTIDPRFMRFSLDFSTVKQNSAKTIRKSS